MASGAKAFVVDDEQIIAVTLALILRSAGYEAMAFTNPEQALSASRAAQPDILLSDIHMPGMSGPELAEALLEHAPRCRVVLLSGTAAAAGMLEEAERAGRRFHALPKPVRPAELLAYLARLTAPRNGVGG